MSKPKLTYFDAPISRGEECRLALHAGGVDFEDVRITRDAWVALKPTTPFGSLPVFELPGRPPLAQSNAILAYVGRGHGLHPADPFDAARHEAILAHCEDLRAAFVPSLRTNDEAVKKSLREAIVETTLPRWADSVERQIADGPFFAGAKLHVVDIKLYVVVGWLASGKVDHVPATVFAGYPKLTRLHAAVREEPRIVSWQSRK